MPAGVSRSAEPGPGSWLAQMGSPGVFGMWFRVTAGLRKIDGTWLITHLHASTPFYMDQTMGAAIDLQP